MHAVAWICGALLAVSFFALGFAACAASSTTRMLSTINSDFTTSPYGHDQLIEAAVATRDYTVDGISRKDLATTIVNAARISANEAEGSKAIAWNKVAAQTDLFDESADVTHVMSALAKDERFALDDEALSHLDDCYRLISGCVPWLIAFALIAAALAVLLAARGQRVVLSRVLICAPLALGCFMIICGMWAAVDFDGLFGIFHAILFPQGNWTFSADSLLICMYPLDFWVSMGAIWLACTLIACIIAFAIGWRLKKSA